MSRPQNYAWELRQSLAGHPRTRRVLTVVAFVAMSTGLFAVACHFQSDKWFALAGGLSFPVSCECAIAATAPLHGVAPRVALYVREAMIVGATIPALYVIIGMLCSFLRTDFSLWLRADLSILEVVVFPLFAVSVGWVIAGSSRWLAGDPRRVFDAAMIACSALWYVAPALGGAVEFRELGYDREWGLWRRLHG